MYAHYSPFSSEIKIDKEFYNKLMDSNFTFDKILRLLSLGVILLAKNGKVYRFDPYKEGFHQLVLASQSYIPVSKEDCA